MRKTALRVTAAQCDKCLDIVFSRDRHDFHRCSCGDIAIDGGRSYTKLSFATKAPHTFDLHLIGISEGNLYDDWSRGQDKFGTIKTKKVAYGMLYRYTLNAKGKFYRYEKKEVV